MKHEYIVYMCIIFANVLGYIIFITTVDIVCELTLGGPIQVNPNMVILISTGIIYLVLCLTSVYNLIMILGGELE